MLFRWFVDPHIFGLERAAGVPASARWIGLAGSLVDFGSLLANGLDGSTVEKVDGEWSLMAITHNIGKLHWASLAAS